MINNIFSIVICYFSINNEKIILNNKYFGTYFYLYIIISIVIMVKELFNILKQNNLTIASAESITGGAFSSLVVKEAGASEFLKGAFVCYTNEYKYNVLGVSKDIEIVSEQMAIELAESTKEKANSSIAISFTGNSSPNGIEGKLQGLT